MNIQKLKEIIQAGAIGDAFGYYVEFDTWEQIQYKYGEQGLQLSHIHQDNWHVSDDTQMTLFCWYALLQNYGQASVDKTNENIYNAFIDWFYTQYHSSDYHFTTPLGANPLLHKRQAPGQTCLSALGSHKMGTMTKLLNNSKGCGGIMRVAPVAFYPGTDEQVFLLGAKQAAITHSHPTGFLASGFFALLLKKLCEGEDFPTAMTHAKAILKSYSKSEEILIYLDRLEKIMEKNIILEHTFLSASVGHGWVAEEALGVAIYASQKAKDFYNCMDLALNHCGDSDSTASLAAQLYVAQHGLPENDIVLDVQPIINELLAMTQEKLNLSPIVKMSVPPTVAKKSWISKWFHKIVEN